MAVSPTAATPTDPFSRQAAPSQAPKPTRLTLGTDPTTVVIQPLFIDTDKDLFLDGSSKTVHSGAAFVLKAGLLSSQKAGDVVATGIFHDSTAPNTPTHGNWTDFLGFQSAMPGVIIKQLAWHHPFDAEKHGLTLPPGVIEQGQIAVHDRVRGLAPKLTNLQHLFFSGDNPSLTEETGSARQASAIDSDSSPFYQARSRGGQLTITKQATTRDLATLCPENAPLTRFNIAFQQPDQTGNIRVLIVKAGKHPDNKGKAEENKDTILAMVLLTLKPDGTISHIVNPNHKIERDSYKARTIPWAILEKFQSQQTWNFVAPISTSEDEKLQTKLYNALAQQR